MIAFGCVTVDERAFRAYGAPSIELAAENSSTLMRRHRGASPGASFNEMLDSVCAQPGLEAVILTYDRTAMTDTRLLSKVRRELEQRPDTAVIGAPLGGMPQPAGVDDSLDAECVDGAMIVLSAWAARNLRFEDDPAASPENRSREICDKARAAGRRVLATGFEVSLGQEAATAPVDAAGYEISVEGRHLLVPRERPIPIREDAVRGFVDSVAVDGETVVVAGWVTSADMSEAATAAVAFVDRKGVAADGADGRRDDVFGVYGEPLMKHSGFAVKVAISSLEPAKPAGGLTVFGIVGDVAGELPWASARGQRTVEEACER